MSYRPAISVAFPVHNEAMILEDNVGQMVRLLEANYDASGWELIIVDNQSTDGTFEVAKRIAAVNPRIRSVYIPIKGVGAALRTGWLESYGKVVAYMDADLPFRPENLVAAIGVVIGGDDIVIGSRYVRGGTYRTTSLRRMLSKNYIRWLNLLFGIEVTDNCGLKAMRKDVFMRLVPYARDNGWFFGTELIVAARLFDLRLAEVPVQCENNDVRPSSVRILTTILAFVKRSLELRIKLSLMRRRFVHG